MEVCVNIINTIPLLSIHMQNDCILSLAKSKMMSNYGQFRSGHVHVEKAKYSANKLWPLHEQIYKENSLPMVEL